MILPQVLLRIPCYDFTPVISFTVVPYNGTSGTPNFHGVTGGVCKAQEHIQRDMADSRLLAIPTSRRRISAFDPDWDRLLRLAPPRGFATHCIGHCSTSVAPDIRATLI